MSQCLLCFKEHMVHSEACLPVVVIYMCLKCRISIAAARKCLSFTPFLFLFKTMKCEPFTYGTHSLRNRAKGFHFHDAVY